LTSAPLLEFITRNAGWKLFALAASFAIWLNVAREPDLSTIVNVPVEYANAPKDLEISSNIVAAVTVEAAGPAPQMRNLPAANLAAVLDFSGITEPGERTFTLTTKEIRLPRGTQLIRAVPAQLRFRFEKRDTRAVPVEVAYSGALPEGLKLGKVEVMPPMLEIMGPESHVKAARRLVTDPVDLTRVTGTTDATLAVYAAETQVRFSGVPQVTVKIEVQRTH